MNWSGFIDTNPVTKHRQSYQSRRQGPVTVIEGPLEM